jgi:hypothetical protein
MHTYNEETFTAALREHNGTMFQADGLNAMLSVFAMSEHLGLKVVPTTQELNA